MAIRFCAGVLVINLLAVLYVAIGIARALPDLWGKADLSLWAVPGWAVVCVLAFGAAALLGAIPEGWEQAGPRRFQWTGTGVIIAGLLAALGRRLFLPTPTPGVDPEPFCLGTFAVLSLIIALFAHTHGRA